MGARQVVLAESGIRPVQAAAQPAVIATAPAVLTPDAGSPGAPQYGQLRFMSQTGFSSTRRSCMSQVTSHRSQMMAAGDLRECVGLDGCANDQSAMRPQQRELRIQIRYLLGDILDLDHHIRRRVRSTQRPLLL